MSVRSSTRRIVLFLCIGVGRHFGEIPVGLSDYQKFEEHIANTPLTVSLV